MTDATDAKRGLVLDAERESARIVSFIQDYCARAGFGRAVLNLSGGVDSALVASLCARALGSENVLALILPYETSSPQSEAHARMVVQATGIRCAKYDITPMVKALVDHFADMDGRRRGNVMARCRMIYLYDQSVAFDALPMGTSNRTETLLGYFTLHGDGAAAVEPIAHLYKCQVRALSQYLGVPQAILDKAPSADLWAGQTDEGELGFTYDEADAVLYMVTERGLDENGIVSSGLPRGTVQAIIRRMRATRFKRLPPPDLVDLGSAH